MLTCAWVNEGFVWWGFGYLHAFGCMLSTECYFTRLFQNIKVLFPVD